MFQYLNCMSVSTSPMSAAAARLEPQCSPTDIEAAPKRTLRRMPTCRSVSNGSASLSSSKYSAETIAYSCSVDLPASDYSTDSTNISKLSSINGSFPALTSGEQQRQPIHSTPRSNRRSLRHQPSTADVVCVLSFDSTSAVSTDAARPAPALRRQQASVQLAQSSSSSSGEFSSEVTSAITSCVSSFLNDDEPRKIRTCVRSTSFPDYSNQKPKVIRKTKASSVSDLHVYSMKYNKSSPSYYSKHTVLAVL